MQAGTLLLLNCCAVHWVRRGPRSKARGGLLVLVLVLVLLGVNGNEFVMLQMVDDRCEIKEARVSE